ncbi:MAG: SDR family oxidoreductase [Syntrophaceae bacterium]|nr:SDR family oxidoreductase [Syntrophaceae bacterium]
MLKEKEHLSKKLKDKRDIPKIQKMISGKKRVGVIGATSFIGDHLLPLLAADDYDVLALTRRLSLLEKQTGYKGITWQLLLSKNIPMAKGITKWIILAPIWVLPQHFTLLLRCGAKHVVALSSTSCFTKESSTDSEEKKLAEKIKRGEAVFISWAQQNNLKWTILRPTLVYAWGRDKNISVIYKFIKKLSFFPLMAQGNGLRQPVHAQDVAMACVAALNTEKSFNRAYNISGGEILSYRRMVEKIFESIGKKPRFVILPISIFRIAIFFLRILPRFRHWSAAMAERMNQNLVFDHHEAKRDLNFAPREFMLTHDDIYIGNKI